MERDKARTLQPNMLNKTKNNTLTALSHMDTSKHNPLTTTQKRANQTHNQTHTLNKSLQAEDRAEQTAITHLRIYWMDTDKIRFEFLV